MNQFIKNIIEEKFESKKQQKFFYAKANDKSLSKKERKKWSKWADEYSSKTNFKKIPEKVTTEIDEVVDEDGNIIRGGIKPDIKTKGTTSKSMTDKVVKTGMGLMGTFGIAGGGNTHRTLRYWAESDMSKMLGYENTLGDNENYEEAKDYFEDNLGIDTDETEERLEQMGYDKQLPNEKVRLIETPKKFIEEYIENLISKKNKPNDIVEKDNTEKKVPPIIKKQMEVLIKTLEKNNLSLKDVLKQIEKDE